MAINPSYIRQLQYIRDMDAFDEAPRLDMDKLRNRLGEWEARRPRPLFSSSSFSSPSRGSPNSLEQFISSIVDQESGGNYTAVNRSSGALGKYQIMPGNIPSWSREVLGRSVTSRQFLNSPQLQEQIARYKLAQYVNQYGLKGAAAAWYGGPGAVKNINSTKTYGQYPSISTYVSQIMNRMGY